MKKKVKSKISQYNFFSKNRRGELTTQQLVTIIILIVSFIVILFLLWRLNLGEVSDKEICHNSVVMKSQSKLNTGSIDCKTSYVCVSMGGDCEDFTESVKVGIEDESEIAEVLQKEIDDCWWMFGEGKIDYLGLSDRGFLSKTNCAICSIIKFDNKIQEEISEVDFNNEKILTSEKYSIVTGMKSKIAWGIGSDEIFIYPNVTKSNEITSKLDCEEFITKA